MREGEREGKVAFLLRLLNLFVSSHTNHIFTFPFLARTLSFPQKMQPITSQASIENVVVNFNLGTSIPLAAFACATHSRYGGAAFAGFSRSGGAASFPGVVTRCHETDNTSTTFSSGQVNTVGCKSREDGLRTSHLHAQLVQERLGIACRPRDFLVTNLVARVDVLSQRDRDEWVNPSHVLNLSLLAEDCANYALPVLVAWITDPATAGAGGKGVCTLASNFPGMVVVIKDARYGGIITLTMCASGQGVAVGLKYPEQLETCRRFMSEVLATHYLIGKEYRTQDAQVVRPAAARGAKRKLRAIVPHRTAKRKLVDIF